LNNRAASGGEELSKTNLSHKTANATAGTRTVKQAKREHPELAKKGIIAEMQQMLNLNVFDVVNPASLTPEEIQEAISSFMFAKDKFDSLGNLNAIKMRLTLRGDLMDLETVIANCMTEMLFKGETVKREVMLAAIIVSAQSKANFRVIDVSSAFCHTRLPKHLPPTYIVLTPEAVSGLLIIKPELEQYVTRTGCMFARLRSYLYGHKEGPRAWQELITADFKCLGYRINPYDNCLFQRGQPPSKDSSAAVVHVDDIYAYGTEEQLDTLEGHLNKKYNTRSARPDSEGRIPYLGMDIIVTHNSVHLEGFKYIQNMLVWWGVPDIKTALTPAASNLFDIDLKSPPLVGLMLKKFRSGVAKGLYAVVTVIPTGWLSMLFLTSRPNNKEVPPNQQDFVKLHRFMRYASQILTTRESLCVWRRSEGSRDLQITCSIDSSFNSLTGGRSIGGVSIYVGDGGSMWARSRVLRITTDSSSSAELVAVAELSKTAFFVRNLFETLTGQKQPAANIEQDNSSTIQLLRAGKGIGEGTRWLHWKVFWVTGQMKDENAVLTKRDTKLMSADLLTKPLQGTLAQNHQAEIMRGRCRHDG